MGRPASNTPRPAAAPALSKWPAAPRAFSKAERAEWARLGKAAMAAGTITEADLVVAENCARLSARLAAMYADPKSKAATIGALARLVKEHLVQLGLTPQARKSVQAPAPALLDADDPLAEFSR
jgi:hypothetical protein